MNEPIYLDNAATTAVCPAAEAAFLQAAKQFGNPSSLHALGFAAERLVAEARASIIFKFDACFAIRIFE